MDFERFYFNFKVGITAILHNRLRAFLTSLGIIFGVAAVISMLAIGSGAEKEILEQIKQVGSNNIIVKPLLDKGSEDGEEDDGQKRKGFSPGLTLKDAENIQQTIQAVVDISPEIEMETNFIYNGLKGNGKLIGVNNFYFEVAGLELNQGQFFSQLHLDQSEPVCIIGKEVKTRFFAGANPIGKKIKCKNVWLTIIGVLDAKNLNENSVKKLSIRNANRDIYTPVKTMLLRFKNRDLVTAADLREQENDDEEASDENLANKPQVNYHQLDRLVVKVDNSENISPAAEVIDRILLRRHNQEQDFEIVIPELLLKQEQRTKKLFNTVLGVIASISLLVGGIGIMNIMLASVMERIKEIGLRMSIGARKRDIVMQFLSEALTICISGGVIGILLGILLSVLIEQGTDIKTIVSPISVMLSFFISIAVGIVFGIMPARKASQQDPVNSLRHE